jgi:hypothetical protein
MGIRKSYILFAAVCTVVSVMSCGGASSVAGTDVGRKTAPPSPPAIEPTAVYSRLQYSAVKYVLYPLGRFELHYGPYPAYVGGYTQTDSTIAFDFVLSGCAIPECSKMTGSAQVHGDTLVVRYDAGATWLLCADMMDFEVCDTHTSTYVRSH